jgi:hypothetical protein
MRRAGKKQISRYEMSGALDRLSGNGSGIDERGQLKALLCIFATNFYACDQVKGIKICGLYIGSCAWER